jgi:branched-chain amino acid transport system permease protein
MDLFLALVINGFILGGIYALVVTGLNLLLLESGILQYAYPHLIVLSMYACWFVLKFTDGNIALGILSALFSGIILGLASEPLFRSVSKKGASMASFIISLGIAIIITDLLSREINMGIQIAFPDALKGTASLLQFGMAVISLGQLLTVIGSVLVVGIVFYFLHRTKTGRAIRSMAQSPGTARLMGLPVRKLGLYSYAIAGTLGGVSSIFLMMAVGSASSALGNGLAIKILAVAILAGLGNLRGGLVAALILGLAESFAMGYLPGDWTNAIAFGMIMVIVIIRPQGLFGVKA